MRTSNYRKIFSSLLALTIVFTMLFPLYGSAATSNVPAKNQLQMDSGTLDQMKEIIDQEKTNLLKKPELHPDLQNLTGDKEVSVIVGMTEYPVALAKGINKIAGKSFSTKMEQTARQNVVNQQQTFVNALSTKGINAKLGFRYNEVFNGIAMTVKASQVKDLLSLPGVQFVEPDIEMKAFGEPSGDGVSADGMLNTDNPYLNVPDVWKLGYQGQGVKVGVIDTGIDYLHPELKDVYKGGHNFIDQSSSKDYTRTRDYDDPYETSPVERPAGKAEFDAKTGEPFYTEHGTHVAGTIAAQGKKVIGIAPKVELYAYRALGAYGSGSNSGIIKAIDTAVQEKMDIINLSLGSATNSQVSSDAIAINNAMLAGTTAVVATGNDGPNRGTIGSPSTAAFAISVANSTVPEATKKATVKIEGGTYSKESVLDMMAWKSGQDPAGVLTGEMDLVPVPNVGSADDYKGLDVKGKVALVSRGTIAYVEKLAAAKDAGAKGVIIYNSQSGSGTPGPPDNAFLGDSFTFIPSFAMSYTDGNALATALGGKTGKVTFSNYTTGQTTGDDVNDSSSRGPANPNYDLKPDITAPGTNIMSSVPAYGKDYPDASYDEAYDRFTGTSMATPHVAGIAALLKSQHPNWSPFDIKVAISNTAKQLDTKKYDVFAQGPGLVQPLQAATTEALAYSYDKTTYDSTHTNIDNIKGTITFGNVATGNAITITKDVKVKNLTGNASDYDVTVETTKAATGTLAGANVTVDMSSFTLPGSGEQALKVTLTVPKGTGTTGNELLGYVHINNKNGKTKLILPFAANFSPPTGLKSFSIDSYDISPNGDGKLDSTTVRYEFYNSQKNTIIELWDPTQEDVDFGYIVGNSSTTTGAKTVKFDGTYTDWNTSKKVKAPDGVYVLSIYTYTTDKQGNITSVDVAPVDLYPIFIKSSAPKIVTEDRYSATSTSFELSGSIVDKYIDLAPAVVDAVDEDFDVNSKLHAKYELTNSNGEKQEGTTPITLNQDGTFKASINGLTIGENKVKLTVDDAGQNSAVKEIIINVTDATPPVTTATVTGTEGKNGWYTSDVSVKLTATDDFTGVKSTQYKVNDGEWKDYSEPIAFTNEGTSVLEYQSKDNAGNVEAVQTKEIKIDKTAPATTAKVTGTKGENGWYTSDVTVALSASDDNSGVQSTQYRVNDGEWQDYSGEIKLSNEGKFTVNYRSVDKAGNTEDAKSVEVKIEKTAPVVSGVENNAYYNKDVTITFNKGTATLNGQAFTSGTVVKAEGKYTLVVTSEAGIVTTVKFTIDKTAPVVSGVKDNAYYNKDVTITFDKGTATLNGKAFTSGTVVTAEGTYTLVVTSESGIEITVHFTIDKTAPVVSGVKNNAYYNKDVTITFDKGTATLNDEAFTNGTVVTAEGAYTLVVTSKAGNVTTVHFTIDKTAPVVSGVEDNAYYSKDVTITFDKGTATLNGEAFTNGTVVTAEGAYTLIVTSEAGNVTTVNFTIDKTAPVVSGVEDNAYYNKDVTITFDKGTATLNGDAITSGTVVKAEGTYTLIVTSESGIEITLKFTIDKSAPVVSGVKNNAYYNKDVTITFDKGTATLNGKDFTSGTVVTAEGTYTLVVTSESGIGTTVHFTIDKTAPVVSGVKDNTYYNKDVTITFDKGTATLNGKDFTSGTTVKAEGTYTLVVTSESGNVTTVNFTIDKTAPVVSGVKNNAYYNKDVTITFDKGTATLNGKAFTNGTVVKAEGTYTLVVTSQSGNVTTVNFTIDKTAPVVSGVKNNAYYNKNVTVKFDKGTATLNGKAFTSGTVVKADGTYTLVVTSKAGIKTTVKFTIDQKAPKAPTVQQVSDKSTTVTGKTEANAVVKLYIAGKLTQTVTADKSGNYSFTIKKQKAGTQIKVTATDKAGNVSKATTVKVVDKTPPAKPSVDKVTSKSTYVSGKAEKGATVYVYNGKKLLGKGTVNSKGAYKIKIKAQKKGTTLTVYAVDKAKNKSKTASVKVK